MSSIREVIIRFREELTDLYDKEEVDHFIWYAFASVLHFSRTDLLTRTNEYLSENQWLQLYDVLVRLKQYEPIQYILGSTLFYGLEFRVNPAVLIPRPETEELVNLILTDLKKNTKPRSAILDIGTGSGCIAISLKKNLPAAHVAALDVSADALRVAEQNACLNNTDVQFIRADILNEEGTGLPGCWDIIVSNPPYVSPAEKPQMRPNVLNYEPHLALFTPVHDVLVFYRAIAGFAKRHLHKGGKLYFEINEMYGHEVKQLLENDGFQDVHLRKDLNNKFRMVDGTI